MAGWNATGGPKSFTFTNPLDGPAYLSNLSGSYGAVTGECLDVATGRKGTGNGNAVVTISVSGGPSQPFSGLANNNTITDSSGNKYPSPGNKTTCTVNIGTAIEVPKGGSITATVSWTNVICCDSGGDVSLSAGSWSLANHTITCTLHLDGNGSGHDYYPASTATVAPDVWSLPVTISPTYDTRDGYRFQGWYDSSGRRQTGTITVSTSGMTLWAHWDHYISCSATLDGNGSGHTYTPSAGGWVDGDTHNLSLTITPTTDTWDVDHEFLGWYTDPLGGTRIGNTVTLGNGSSPTYYAHWRVRVGFDLDGGDYSFPDYYRELTEECTIPTSIPTKLGHDFKCWLDGSSSTFYDPGDTLTVSGPTILKAIWVKRKVKVLIQDNLHVIPAEEIETTFSSTLNLIPKKKESRFRFVGWDTDENLTGVTKGRKGTNDTEYLNTQNINCMWDLSEYFKYIFGRWTGGYKVSKNKVTYIYDEAFHEEVYNVGEDCLHPSITPTKTDYEFLGWTDDIESTDVLTSCVMETSPFALFAVWKHIDVTIENDINHSYVPGVSGMVGFNLLEVNSEYFDRIDLEMIAELSNKPIDQFTNSYFYLCLTSKKYDNSSCNISTDAIKTFSLRHYIKSGTTILDDPTYIGYNGASINVSFNIEENTTPYITLVVGPDISEAQAINTTIIGHGRGITR